MKWLVAIVLALILLQWLVIGPATEERVEREVNQCQDAGGSFWISRNGDVRCFGLNR